MSSVYFTTKAIQALSKFDSSIRTMTRRVLAESATKYGKAHVNESAVLDLFYSTHAPQLPEHVWHEPALPDMFCPSCGDNYCMNPHCGEFDPFGAYMGQPDEKELEAKFNAEFVARKSQLN